MSRNRVTAPFGRRAAAVTAREQHGSYTVLRCADPGGPPPQAGQFYMLAAEERWGGGDGERPFLPRAFSVLRARTHPAPGRRDRSSSSDSGTGPIATAASTGQHPAGHLELHFMVEDVGPGTNRLCELRPGDGLLLVGPLGAGFRAPREGRAALLVGGGVGIAPLAIWQDQLRPQAPPLLGFRDALHAAGAGLLAGARVATDDGSAGHHGLVTDLLTDELDATTDVEVYACGPPPMLEAVRLICAEREVPAQLALESGMACGFGACFGCVVPTTSGYVRLCLEGPVLDAAVLETAAVAGAGH
jgi:dihydroorotate dehydrogenase electron transfer subunit